MHDEFAFALPVDDPAGTVPWSAIGLVRRNTTKSCHHSVLVALDLVVIIRGLDNLTYHETVSWTTTIVMADHLQRGPELKLPAGSVRVRVVYP